MSRVREIFCISLLLLSACSTQESPGPGPDPGQPVDSVTIPAPPSTGVNPCTGWAPAGAPTVYSRNANGTVSFHSGVWAVPIPATPGRALSDVNFTIEAPTGSAGDPTSVLVELYSFPSQALLGEVALLPAGAGVRVNSDIPLSPAYVPSSGEDLELLFVPFDAAGNYPTSDVKIDSVGYVVRDVRTFKLTPLSGTSSTAGRFQIINGSLTGNWAPNNGDVLAVELPVEVGESFQTVTASVYGSPGSVVTMSIMEQDDAFHVGASLGSSSTASANTLQSLSVSLSETVTSSWRAYYLQFSATRSASDPGQPLVGPILLTVYD